MASYIPLPLVEEAKRKGFTTVLLQVREETLKKRNKERMKREGYEDASQWFSGQLSAYDNLKQSGLIDKTIDGDQSTEEIAKQLLSLFD